MIHFNPDARIAKEEKIRAANKISNTNIACKTCKKVNDCVNELTEKGEVLSDRKGAKFCKVSVNSYRKYKNADCPDVQKTIEELKSHLNLLKKHLDWSQPLNE